MPVSWKGRISQYVGRLHRDYKMKNKVIVYDYVDDMKMLGSMCEKRKRAYKSLEYNFGEL
jgi:superfamily II DNA or RNA helicase